MPHDELTIICPYYHKTLGEVMFCESFSAYQGAKTTGCYFKQEFKDKKSRNACLKNLCTTFKYTNCRFAALNDAVYKDKR